MNKKGLTASQVVLFVIAVIVLVLLVVIALDIGGIRTRILSQYISPVNIDTLRQACANDCSLNSEFNVCCKVRDVKYTIDQKTPEKTTCNLLNIDCPAITCDKSVCARVVCDGDAGKVENIDYIYMIKNECDKKDIVLSRNLNSDLQVLASGEVCCKVVKS